jgi:hypothetical protein
MEIDYVSATVKFAYINNETSKKWQVIASIDDDLPIQKSDVVSRMEREVEKKREEIADLERKRDYFLRHFNQYFSAEVEA